MSNACTSKQTRYTGGFRVLSATHLRDLLPPPCGKICQCFQTFWHILVVWYVDYVDLLTMAMAVLDISELSTVLPPRCRKDGDWQTPGSIWFHHREMVMPRQQVASSHRKECEATLNWCQTSHFGILFMALKVALDVMEKNRLTVNKIHLLEWLCETSTSFAWLI